MSSSKQHPSARRLRAKVSRRNFGSTIESRRKRPQRRPLSSRASKCARDAWTLCVCASACGRESCAMRGRRRNKNERRCACANGRKEKECESYVYVCVSMKK